MEPKKDDRKMRGALPLNSLCAVSAEEKICYAACAQMPAHIGLRNTGCQQTNKEGGV